MLKYIQPIHQLLNLKGTDHTFLSSCRDKKIKTSLNKYEATAEQTGNADALNSALNVTN